MEIILALGLASIVGLVIFYISEKVDKPMKKGYWKQTDYDEYTLSLESGEVYTFKDYSSLYSFCDHFGINATQI